MEQDSNPSGLCKNGCGFYGNHSFEGMCSKCYKDLVKRQQQQPSPPAGSCGSSSALSALSLPQTVAAVTTAASVAEPTPAIDIPSSSTRTPEKSEPLATEGASPIAEVGSASPLDDATDASPGKAKKRNRCYTCRKKVGLTGFECRCGGLFCGIHRYSDKHNCTYDYKADAREQIAKANPVVVGEKVKKI